LKFEGFFTRFDGHFLLRKFNMDIYVLLALDMGIALLISSHIQQKN